MINSRTKPNIDYPCFWPYKIIGSDSVLIPQTIDIILENCRYHVRPSNRSKTGKYRSFFLTVLVDNENERNKIFSMLQKIPTVKMVL